jgi:predicted ester cyclase
VRRAFPDDRITITAQVAEGERVATVWTLRGTHRGEWGPTAGSVAPTGRPVAFTATTTLRVAGGREEGAATLRAVGRV